MRGRLENLLGALSIALSDEIERVTTDASGHGASVPAALSILLRRPGCTIETLRTHIGLSHSATVRLVDRIVALVDGTLPANPVVEILGPDLQDGGEGCLSLPGMGLETVRALRARVTGQDPKGNPVSYEGEGLRARAFQHETDHLNGRLYIDLHPTRARKKIEKEMRESDWFGLHTLDPRSDQYRDAQGHDDEDVDHD